MLVKTKSFHLSAVRKTFVGVMGLKLEVAYKSMNDKFYGYEKRKWK